MLAHGHQEVGEDASQHERLRVWLPRGPRRQPSDDDQERGSPDLLGDACQDHPVEAARIGGLQVHEGDHRDRKKGQLEWAEVGRFGGEQRDCRDADGGNGTGDDQGEPATVRARPWRWM